jgi:hypothetical protein
MSDNPIEEGRGAADGDDDDADEDGAEDKEQESHGGNLTTSSVPCTTPLHAFRPTTPVVPEEEQTHGDPANTLPTEQQQDSFRKQGSFGETSTMPNNTSDMNKPSSLSNDQALPPPVIPFVEKDLFTNSVRELRDAEAKFKAAKKRMREVKQTRVEKSQSRQKKVALQKELKIVALEVKAEDALVKLKVQDLNRRRKRDLMCDDSDESLSDITVGMATKKTKRTLSTIDKWQQGHRAAALAAAQAKTVAQATVRSWPDAYDMLCKYGFAVVDDFVDLFHPDCAPSIEQRDYMYNRKYYSSTCNFFLFHGPSLTCLSYIFL